MKSARIDGYEPLEIVAKDMTTPISERPTMELVMTNILNRKVSGNLQVKLGNLLLDYPVKISFKPNETKTIKVNITGGDAVADNTYPLDVCFDGGKDGLAVHWEDMHVNYITKQTIMVDGKLDDWTNAIPQPVKGSSDASVSLTEAAWYPFKNFETNADGMATAYLAYDEDYFYFAAKVADKTPNKGSYRFETRNDDEFFYPDVAHMQTALAMHSVERKQDAGDDDRQALQVPRGFIPGDELY